MKVYLAATEDLYRARVQVKVKRLLISYFGAEPRLAEGLKSALNPEDWCIDSGAHFFLSALFKHNRKPPVQEAEEHLVKYLAYLEAMPTKPRFAVELDLQDLYGVQQIEKWRDDLLFPFQKRTGIDIAIAWHLIDGEAAWVSWLKKPEVRYLGLGGTRNISHPAMLRLVLSAFEAGKPVHGFAAIRAKLLKEVPFYSVDSTSWGAGSLFGTVHSFDAQRGMIIGKSAGRSLLRTNPSKAVGNLMGAGGRIHLRDLMGVGVGGSLSRMYQEAALVHEKFEQWYTAYWRARGIDWEKQIGQGHRSAAVATGVP